MTSDSSAPAIEAVVYEDRPGQLVGVELLVASAARHSPSVHLTVVAPGSPAPFRDWVAEQPNADLRELSTRGASGWNVKPALLTAMLEAGVSPVVWLDSDMIVAGDLAPLLTRSPGALLTTEDWWYARGQRSTERTEGWGLPVGRTLPRPVNTAVLRVEDRHRDLLDEWERLSADPRYTGAQRRPHAERPLHLLGGQEVLGALLGSRRWADTEVAYLRRGTEIAQCFGAAGFSPGERLRARIGRGVPAIVHAMGTKPWRVDESGRPPAGAELSPYVALAAGYRDQVPDPLTWTSSRTAFTRVADRLTGGDPVLRQLGPATAQAAVWSARQAAGRVRRRVRRTGTLSAT